QDEFGLNMYDMDFRDYDPAIGRWVVIDPIDHFGQSPYNGYDSNPVLFADPSGATTSFDNWVQGVEDDWAAIDAGANPFSVFNARIDSNHRRDVTERIKNRRFMSALIDALTGMLGPRGLSVKAGPLSEETEQTKYREKGAKNGEIFNFDNSLLDRFKDSGLNPEAKVGVDLDRNKEIMKVIDKVGGLKEFYAAMGSPKITDYGSSSMGYRGFTFPNNTIAIYNGAYSNYFLLASTIFHELVHIYQNLLAPLNSFESEQQSYRVEWKLGDPSLKRKYKDIYRSIWIHTYFNDKYPY
ncbi:MAG: hypothetical protein PSV16_11390, partial [Flavobacterium sp.]|nr:hypothetical protein [Flavobacterium sp.]